MDPRTLLEHLAIEGGRIAAITAAQLGTEVPSMPGWTIGRVVGHLGFINEMAAADAAGGVEPTDHSTLPVPPRDDTVLSYYAAGHSRAQDVLGGLDPDTGCATWNGTQTVGWWIRRLTHETAMHRWDLENALGSPTPFNAALAVDGINEIFDLFTSARFDSAAFGASGETIHLHATDIDGEWLATFTSEGVSCERTHAKGDVAARASASDLLLALWSRKDHGDLEVFGDASLIERWQATANF